MARYVNRNTTVNLTANGKALILAIEFPFPSPRDFQRQSSDVRRCRDSSCPGDSDNHGITSAVLNKLRHGITH